MSAPARKRARIESDDEGENSRKADDSLDIFNVFDSDDDDGDDGGDHGRDASTSKQEQNARPRGIADDDDDDEGSGEELDRAGEVEVEDGRGGEREKEPPRSTNGSESGTSSPPQPPPQPKPFSGRSSSPIPFNPGAGGVDTTKVVPSQVREFNPKAFDGSGRGVVATHNNAAPTSRPVQQPQGRPPQPPPSVFRLEPSLFGKRPEDDTVLQVCDFLWRNLIAGRQDGAIIEIEGKLGLIIDKATNRRIQLPVRSETVISNESGQYVFDSDMTLSQHGNFNKLLNFYVEQGQGRRVQYAHTKIMDEVYESRGNKVRVSTDQKTKQIIECVTKRRLANLEIHLPNSHLDIRITVSLEIPADPSLLRDQMRDRDPQLRRAKDRLSYTHEAIRVDLTQVVRVDPYGREESRTHEVEVEFLNSAHLLEEKTKRHAGQPDNFNAYVSVFMNNLRGLCRKAISHELR
ncbi:CYTH-like domain-containing protein [Fimicolochytrium jonesii]|uniref:CYTH-like domain-containing protein n=1 Tax=Fimicolochytrium jonesii TaxID=1396493 RepID=UPI0022FDC9E5|nr:CYTH-like domain-containing protein [Fimicolochytrium jonesii]KAI8820124.1 CYTH-like domain-containing protein [Fimicolochytrium jonesii]